jgi:hypothetical protein
MFKCENIQYKAYPVTNYREMQHHIEESRVYDKVKMFMFINCGGLIDLTEYWFVQEKQAQVFLFDMHEPIYHANVASPDVPPFPPRSKSSTLASKTTNTVPLTRTISAITN